MLEAHEKAKNTIGAKIRMEKKWRRKIEGGQTPTVAQMAAANWTRRRRRRRRRKEQFGKPKWWIPRG